MNVNFKHFKILVPLILISVSFIFAFNTFLERLNYDAQRKNAQFAILDSDITLLKELSGNDNQTMLAILKNQVGISTIIIPEYTVASFERMAKLTVLPGYQIINTTRVGQLYRTVLSQLRRKTSIDSNATYIIVDEVKVYKRVISHLKLFLPRDSVIEHTGRIIQVNIPFEKVLSLPLGFSESLISSYASFGFNIVPELKSYTTFSKSKIDYTFSELGKNDRVKSVMFAKNYNFGDTDFSDHLISNIERSDYKLIFPEFSKSEYDQASHLRSIASTMPSEVVISHGLLKKDNFSSFKLLFDRYMRALNERTPHLLILSPVKSSNVANLYDKNILFMRKVIESYERSGGENVDYFPVLNDIKSSFLEQAIIGLGIFAAIFLVILKVHRLSDRRQYIFLISGLSLIYLIIMGLSSITVVLLGLIAVILGPTFGMIYYFPNDVFLYGMHRRRKLFYLVKYLFQVIGVCMIAVIYCVALYSEPVYLQNIIPFRGVKLALLFPVILVGLYFYCGDRRVNSIYYVLRRVFRFPLTLSAFFVLITATMVIMLYIFRSGNYLQLSGIEASVRLFLEEVFLIRPRFKEFLIGYPALLFGFWFADRKFKDMLWFLNALGVISLASLINSFCHFHTPVLISLYRSFWGLIIGCILSVVIYYIYLMIHRLIKSLSFISE